MSNQRIEQALRAKPKAGGKPEALLQAMWDRAMKDPHIFLFGDELQNSMVYTLDEHDADKPVKPLPDRPHLRVMTDLWVQSQKLIIAKSRQMMVSWHAMSMIVWAILRPGRQWGVACKKFEDADALLSRGWHIIEQLPLALRPKATRKEGLIRVEHDLASSQVMAFAQDSAAPRSRTFSGMLIDEGAFTDNLDKLYTASLPTVQAGGQLVIVSTPQGRGLFYDLISDNGRLAL